MNQSSQVTELQKQLSDRKSEIEHLNAVNQELQDMLTEVKRQGRNFSDAAGNAQTQLSHANAQLAVLKRDMVRLRPDYDLSKVSNAHLELYSGQTIDQLARIFMETAQQEAWQLIEKEPGKVVSNLLDSRTGLIAELKTGLANFAARDSIALLQTLEKSALDILARVEA